MIDIKCCKGNNCYKRDLCTYYDSYIFKVNHGYTIDSIINNNELTICPHYKQKEFYGE